MVMEQMAYEHGEYLRRRAVALRRDTVARRVAERRGRRTDSARVIATVAAHLRHRPATAGCEA